MSKERALNVILLFAIITAVYGLWAIQPLVWDDWCFTKTHALIYRPSLPQTGQEIRYRFSSESFFPVNPFSLFRPWSLLTAVFFISLIWTALINESITVRAGLTLLAALGFPCLAHVGAWNFVASMYTVSVLWVTAWYAVFRKCYYQETFFALRCTLFFVLTFIAASWHEVWLISFSAVIAYLFFNMLSLIRKKNSSFILKRAGIYASIFLGYMAAIAFYTRGGPGKFIDSRNYSPGQFASFWNSAYLINVFLSGTKESMVLIKDGLPVFLSIIYIKLNKDFKTKLSSDFKLFLAASLGVILFIYAVMFVHGALEWRVRWLCMLPLSVALYALPESVLIGYLGVTKNDSCVKIVRFFSIVIAVVWLSYNAFFTYAFTNIDVVKYLQYRQMVLAHNPDVMKKLGPCTLPKNRPTGAARWDHAWGAQDDRYRTFLGPSDDLVQRAVKDIWEHQNLKK